MGDNGAKKWCAKHSRKHCLLNCDNCWQLNEGFECEQQKLEEAYNAGYSACLRMFHNTFRSKKPQSGKFILVWGRDSIECDVMLCKTLFDGSCINLLNQEIETYGDDMMWCYIGDIIPKHNKNAL